MSMPERRWRSRPAHGLQAAQRHQEHALLLLLLLLLLLVLLLVLLVLLLVLLVLLLVLLVPMPAPVVPMPTRPIPVIIAIVLLLLPVVLLLALLPSRCGSAGRRGGQAYTNIVRHRQTNYSHYSRQARLLPLANTIAHNVTLLLTLLFTLCNLSYLVV
jgi:hypothetical protein